MNSQFRNDRLVLRRARSHEDLAQVYRLNYRTFVEEIPQHQPNDHRMLIDDLLATSTCLIALRDDQLVGMVAISGTRPFSLDRKLTDLDRLLPANSGPPCELRLLAIESGERGGLVFSTLLAGVVTTAQEHGYEIGLISATTRQMRLYRHLGAQPFGPRLGTDEAPFQGMFFTWDRLPRSVDHIVERQGRIADPSEADRSEPGLSGNEPSEAGR